MKKIQKYNANTEEELIKIAFDFSSFLKESTVIFLKGELGAGKTTFVKGIAKALGIKDIITSPTYTIIKDYENKLCHIDAYRITNEDIGIDYYIQNKYIIAIEWFENIEEFVQADYIVQLDYLQQGREITIYEQ